jgi:hypothetical protein
MLLSHPNSNHSCRILASIRDLRKVLIAFPAIILFITALFTGGLHAQGNTSGGFRGVVRDKATGNSVAGARVVLRNRQFGTQATVITDENGTYSKGSLPPGTYDIEVSAAGYVTQMKEQTLYAMASYTVEPDPFDLIAVSAVVTPPVGVPAVTPTPAAPVAGGESGQGSESIPLNPRRGGIFDSRSVVTLPLGSMTLTRTFDELAFLVPGVNPPPQAIGNSVGPGIGGGVGTSGQFSVNGLRSRANNFTVDGSDNNDEDIGVRRQGFFSLVPQPIESIQEFQIITLLAPAEFGRNLGAQVNALSKSGGNELHGSIFGFLNADSLNARNYFDNTRGDTTTNLTSDGTPGGIPVFQDGGQRRVFNNAGEKDDFTLLQGGFAVGGPIAKNKLFFFVSGEGQEMDGTQERNFAVPTVAQRGLFNSGATGLMTNNGDPVFPTSIGGDEVFSLFPFANNPTGVYGANTYTEALSTDANGLILSGRIDWNLFKINENQQTLTARYNYTDDERDLTDVGGALFSAIRPKVRTDNFSSYLSGGITANASNEFRFSYGRTRLNFEELPDQTGFILPVTRFGERDNRFLLNARLNINNTLPGGVEGCVVGTACYITSTSATADITSTLGPVGQLMIAGFSPVGVDVFNFPQQRENQTFQFADTVRWQVNRHSFAFGADIRLTELDSELERNSRPLVTFNGSRQCTGFDDNGNCNSFGFATPTDLAAAGAPTGFFQSLVLPGRDSRIKLNYDQLNFFAQDEWRISRKTLLSLGVRYEYNTTPKEADNKIEDALVTPLPPRVADLAAFIDGRTEIFEPDTNNFAFRLGFAHYLNEKTVIRGGVGTYYDQILGAVVGQSRNIFPTFTTINFGGGNNFLCGEGGCSGLAFSLFNPINGMIGAQPLIQSGSINTLNPVFVSGGTPSNPFLDLIFNNFPFSTGTPFGATYPTRQLDTPFSYQYSAGIEREVYDNHVFSAAYVGTTGRDLLRFTTPNSGANYVTIVDGVFALNSQPIVVGRTRDPVRDVPGIGPINQFETTGRSQYHSLQLAIRGRFNNSFYYQANYVYGKVEDDVSDVFDLAGAPALPQNSRNFAGEYAPANFDVRHRFTYNFIYQLPRFSNYVGVVKHLFGSWEVAGTGRFNTGQPFTVNSIFDVNLDGNLTDRLDNLQSLSMSGDNRAPLRLSCTGEQCLSMLANFGEDGSIGRNTFRAGNLLDLDMAISRRFRITETQDVQFRIDFFNFIDRANFAIPVRYLESPGFGSAVQTITPGRRVQFGLKYNF